MSSEDVVIDIQNVSKRYEIYGTPRDRLKQLVLPRLHQALNRCASAIGIAEARTAPHYFKEFWALRSVSFQIRRGETVGIIGRNGGGKSTLLQIIAGTLAPTSGDVETRGRIAALLELGSGFNPEFSGRENVFMNGRILGMTQSEIEARYDQIVEFAEIGEFIDEPVKTYSSGMFLRLAFAVQAHIDASIVIIDEALAVGDVFFRQKCYGRLDQLRQDGAAILLVSHAMSDIQQYCERAVLLDHGEMKFVGSAKEATRRYYLLHQGWGREGGGPAGPVTEAPQCDGSMGSAPRLPPMEAFRDLSTHTQVGSGEAVCLAATVCDAAGTPSNTFRQGERAVFYFMFEVRGSLGMPICGLVISNERGVIVYGKNSLQFVDEVPVAGRAGSRIVCRHEVTLGLALGEYVYELGLASMSEADWSNRARMSHDEQESRIVRVCHVLHAGSFSIGYANENGANRLTHHGIANLDSNAQVHVLKGRRNAVDNGLLGEMDQ